MGLFRATAGDVIRRRIEVLIQFSRFGRRAAAIPQRPNADDAHPPTGEERENVTRLQLMAGLGDGRGVDHNSAGEAEPGGPHRCGLTREPLSDSDFLLICREHTTPEAA